MELISRGEERVQGNSRGPGGSALLASKRHWIVTPRRLMSVHQPNTALHLPAASSGIGYRISPRNTSPKISSISPCSAPLSDRKLSDLVTLCAPPSISETRPPASCTNRHPAATSHGFNPNSQKKSRRPHATYAISIAADPVRRTPCDAIANW